MNENWHTAACRSPIEALAEATQTHSDEVLLDFSGHTLTFSELLEECCRLAHGLRELGVGRGDTVVCMLDNNPENVISWFAITSLGAISVPINTAYKGEFLRHQLWDSQARVAIVEAAYAGRFTAVASALSAELILLVRGTTSIPDAPFDTRLLGSCRTNDVSRPAVDTKPGDLNSILYTAGTTGVSKGCMLSNTFVHTMATTALGVQGRQPGERIWTPLPLFHLNAMTMSVLSSILIGSSASIAPKFSVSNFWPEVLRSGADIVSLLGSMVTMIAQMDDTAEIEKAYGQLRVAYAAPFPPESQRIWRKRFGVKLAGCTVYGQTETGFAVSAPLDGNAPPKASGRRNDLLELMIVDDNDHELPANEVGEVVVRPKAPHVIFEGYWRQPEYTVSLWRNLWYHTGDLGRFDEDGWFYFEDRKADYLRRRGENISSFEVEASFRAHPDVSEVAVVGVPSEVSEDDVKVVAVLRDGAALTQAELFAWAVENIPFFALPRYIEFAAALPKNLVGRVLKYELRADRGDVWDRQAAGIVVQR